jgi:signal transduction histidine kinase
VSLGIVERHGGRILVESEVGKGSVFTVCLPLSGERSDERSMVGRMS